MNAIPEGQDSLCLSLSLSGMWEFPRRYTSAKQRYRKLKSPQTPAGYICNRGRRYSKLKILQTSVKHLREKTIEIISSSSNYQYINTYSGHKNTHDWMLLEIHRSIHSQTKSSLTQPIETISKHSAIWICSQKPIQTQSIEAMSKHLQPQSALKYSSSITIYQSNI